MPGAASTVMAGTAPIAWKSAPVSPTREKPVRNWESAQHRRQNLVELFQAELADQSDSVDEEGRGRPNLELRRRDLLRLFDVVQQLLIRQSGLEVGLGHARFQHLGLEPVERIGREGPTGLTLQRAGRRHGGRKRREGAGVLGGAAGPTKGGHGNSESEEATEVWIRREAIASGAPVELGARVQRLRATCFGPPPIRSISRKRPFSTSLTKMTAALLSPLASQATGAA